MGKRVGRDGVLKIGTEIIAHVRNWTLDQASPQIDLTAMGDTFADQSTGLPAISGSFSMWFDDAQDPGQALIINGAEFTLIIYPTGEDTGDATFSVDVAISDVNHSGSHDGGIEMNASFVGRSIVTESVVP